MHSQSIGPLQCRISGDPARAQLSVFLCHGYGAPGTDLVPLADEIYSIDGSLKDKIAFVFPEAPHSLESLGMPGGRVWWPINMMKLQEILQTNQLEELTKAEPPGMAETREMFLQFLQAFQTKFDVTTQRCVLGGFSQGAMLTTDISLRLPVSPAGLLIYSGTLLCENDWRALVAGRKGLRVLQTHGMQDPILPFAAAEMLYDLLNSAGLDITFQPFAGPHTIPWQALEMTIKLLNHLLPEANSV